MRGCALLDTQENKPFFLNALHLFSHGVIVFTLD